MTVFGLDISHHQDLGLDLARCKREGISFVFLKATEGNTFLDSEFAANLAEARRAGLLVAAYHYVRASAGASLQVAWISQHVPKNVPIILDVEKNSGAIALTRDLVARLRAAGYRVPLLYLPRWYWQQIGSPSLVGLPPLWSSRYPDNVVGTLQDEWADVPAHYWDGYGGLGVAVLQFTSSAAIAGHQPLDANAYRGTYQQLTALLGGTTQQEDDDMELTDTWDDAKLNALGPTKVGWSLKNTRDNAKAARDFVEDTVIPGVAALRKEVAALSAKVSDLSVGGGQVDVLALAAAIVDEQDRRARDGNANTGPVS